MAAKNSPPECEKALAKYVDEKYFILWNYFKEKKLTQFEDEAKILREAFASGGGTGAAVRAEKELNALEAKFVKWYEGDEDIDDAQMFGSIISFIRDTKARLLVYKSAMEGLAVGSKEKCMELLAKAFEEYKSGAQKACSLAQGMDERTADASSTIMRYIDLQHEAQIVEMMAPSGKNEPLPRALARTGAAHSQLSDLRAHAYHAGNAALQRCAKEALDAFFSYQGALVAAYWFSEQG